MASVHVLNIRAMAHEMEVVSKIMSAVGDLQTEDASLTATVAKVIGDWATALQNAVSSGDTAAIQTVVDDMKADEAALTGSDPTTTVTNPAAPTT